MTAGPLDPGWIVVLNGPPRSGKSSIVDVIQETFDGPWLNLGVDVFSQFVTPPRLRPGIGLRPGGGERPDIEKLIPALYAAFYDSVAAHSRHGLNVVVDVGHHDAYAGPLPVLPDAARRLAGLPALLVGVRCPLPVIMQRRDTGQPGYVATLEELLARADIVSLHVPLTESTHHLIGAAELALMKPTAVIVNTARGPVIDDNALADALEAGTIYGAGLDVFEGEPTVSPRLLQAPRTTLLPHIGSATIATRTRMARLACQGVCDVLAGRTPPNLV